MASKCIRLYELQKTTDGIIMDEIDGMSSNDRGGASELMDIMFKNTP